MKVTRSRQKSYANNIWRDLEFAIDDWVFLKTSLMKGTIRFGQKGKLSLRHIGPFKIKSRIEDVAYRLEFTGVRVVITWDLPGCNQISGSGHDICTVYQSYEAV